VTRRGAKKRENDSGALCLPMRDRGQIELIARHGFDVTMVTMSPEYAREFARDLLKSAVGGEE